MEHNLNRHGTFSSSQVWKLAENDLGGANFGAPALKYIKQVKYEKRLGRAINAETHARATSWGTFMEGRVFKLLPLEYQLVSSSRLFHPTISCWSGAPDLVKPLTVADVKCPVSLEVFCDKIEALQSGVEKYKKLFPEDYWQHISNAILLEENGVDIEQFEAIIYMPYQSELDQIKEEVAMFDGNQAKIAWINYADFDELPHLIEGKQYKNLNTFAFDISKADKEKLTNVIKKAEKRLLYT